MALNDIDWRTINIAQKDAYLSRGEVAMYLGVGTRTISRWEYSKGLPFYKVGNRKFYKREDIDRWMQKNPK